jgi:hypothetical protein
MNSSPPPGTPPSPQSPQPLTQAQQRRQYFIGLGVGLIPLIIFLVSFGLLSSTNSASSIGILGIFAAAFLYFIELLVTIIFLIDKQNRFAGYGLLTAFLASPVIAAVGCSVIPNLVQPH